MTRLTADERSPEARFLTHTPMARAMRQAWAERFPDAPFPAWHPTTAQAWPHAERAVRDAIHARAYELCAMMPEVLAGVAVSSEVRVPRGAVPPTDAVLAAYRAGASLREIGAQFGCDDETVRRVLIRANEPRRAKHVTRRAERPLSPAEQEDIVARYRAEQSSYAIADAFGISDTRVRRILRLAGQPMRDRASAQRTRRVIGTPVNATLRARVTTLRAEGLSHAAIARAVGVSRPRIGQLLATAAA